MEVLPLTNIVLSHNTKSVKWFSVEILPLTNIVLSHNTKSIKWFSVEILPLTNILISYIVWITLNVAKINTVGIILPKHI